MKLKLNRLTFLALTTCTLLVLGTGIVRAISIPPSPNTTFSYGDLPPISVVAQNSAASGESTEVDAVNEATITALREGRGEIPQTPVIRRTVIEGDYALVTWAWGEAGGQTVLSRTDGTWAVLTSGGRSVDDSVLEEAGVPRDTAGRLLEQDRASWQEVNQ